MYSCFALVSHLPFKDIKSEKYPLYLLLFHLIGLSSTCKNPIWNKTIHDDFPKLCTNCFI